MIAHYSADYQPPAPVVEIVLESRSTQRRSAPIRALIDSGADACLVPQGVLDEIRADLGERYWMRSHWGERRLVTSYLVTMELGEIRLPGVSVVGDRVGTEAVLGRDVLNQLSVHLDGLGETVTILR